MKRILIIIFLFALVDGLYSFEAKLIRVIDGDTIEAVTNAYNDINRIKVGKIYRIKLYGIDCPELDQPFGTNAKKFTIKILTNLHANYLEIQEMAKDKYNRIIAKVLIVQPSEWNIKIDLIPSLINSGYAWVSDKYCKDDICQEWKKLQAEAKKKKIGLWSQPNPIPPWEWRKRKKK